MCKGVRNVKITTKKLITTGVFCREIFVNRIMYDQLLLLLVLCFKSTVIVRMKAFITNIGRQMVKQTPKYDNIIFVCEMF